MSVPPFEARIDLEASNMMHQNAHFIPGGRGGIKSDKCQLQKYEKLRTSLVVQWLGVCLLMQGTWVLTLVQEYSTHEGQLGPSPQLLSLCSQDPCNGGSHLSEEPMCPSQRVAPTRCPQKRPGSRNEDPKQSKINK